MRARGGGSGRRLKGGEAGKGSKQEYKELISCSFGARAATTKRADKIAVGSQQ